MPADDPRAAAILGRMSAAERIAIVDFLIAHRSMTPQSAEAGIATATFAELDRVLVEMNLAQSAPLHTYEYQPYER